LLIGIPTLLGCVGLRVEQVSSFWGVWGLCSVLSVLSWDLSWKWPKTRWRNQKQRNDWNWWWWKTTVNLSR
jgi:hypothetical protein